MLVAYNWLALVESREGKFDSPMMVTPYFWTIWSFSEISQFPPDSTAISTITAPFFMLLTISSVTRIGDFLPITKAVVITRSESLILLWISSFCFCKNSAETSEAYPPSTFTSSAPSTVKNLPPKDSTCSLVSGRTSLTSTTAPSLLAVATACNPATPAPKIRTLAGVIVPEAVIINGKIFSR